MRKNDAFAFKNIATTTREMETDAVLQLHHVRSIKPIKYFIQTVTDVAILNGFCGKLVNRFIPLCFRHSNQIFLSNGKHSSSLLFSFANVYCTSSFEDCNSRPKISHKVPRKSYCECPKTAILSLVTRNSAQTKH